ncbi:MAG TPA: phospholipase D-like domain-containing protein, partial [Nordella sp.]|nr:phospholipase D-like domain-containing protein [Nordella sp.]
YGRIRIAASHFRDRSIARLLGRQVKDGASITVIAHDTLRRVPKRIEEFATAQGLDFIRYAHPQGLPMHCKFMLLEAEGVRRVLFGSMNLTLTSRYLNNELLVVLDDAPDIFAAFAARFAHMLAETRQFSTLSEGHDGQPS